VRSSILPVRACLEASAVLPDRLYTHADRVGRNRPKDRDVRGVSALLARAAPTSLVGWTRWSHCAICGRSVSPAHQARVRRGRTDSCSQAPAPGLRFRPARVRHHPGGGGRRATCVAEPEAVFLVGRGERLSPVCAAKTACAAHHAGSVRLRPLLRNPWVVDALDGYNRRASSVFSFVL